MLQNPADPLHANAPLTPVSRPHEPTWSLTRRVIFRFGFVYWTLFCLPLVFTQISGVDWLDESFSQAWNQGAAWVGRHILGMTGAIATAQNGSGDKTVDWLSLFSCLSLALVVTIAWSLVDRRTQDHARLHASLRVIIRYTLAFVLLGYGAIKLVGGQFPFPSTPRLLQTYGESSPMGLLWRFMGASPAYVVFAGAGETLGAVLLLFRRTTTLGALVLGVVLTNVVALNFCYDVPVKINSSHFLAMCIFLLLPDARRLGNVLLFNRATTPAPAPAPLPQPWMRIARRVLKYGAITLVVSMMTLDMIEYVNQRAQGPVHWYDGYWTVERFARAGQDVPPVLTDGSRWKRVKLETQEGKSYIRWRNMDESYGELYSVVVDEARHTMTLTSEDSEPVKVHELEFVRTDPTHFEVTGKIGNDQLTVQFQRLDASNMLLVSRGFRWINEVPFNR